MYPTSLEEKIGQMLVVGFHGYEAPEYLLKWLAEGRIGGVILFGRNIQNPPQVAKMTQAFHQAAKYPLLICIDQEGGTVARLRDGFTESPGAMALGVADSESLAEDVSAMLATELRALGINWNLAPVVDITHDISNPSVGTRSLGRDRARVAQMAAAEVRGFQKAHVAASAKHFPGLGNTAVDTHLALAVIDGSLDYLWEHDLVPFRAVVDTGTATVMISHVKFTELDPEYPATLSPRIIQNLLRQEIGFAGVACTDCMEMKAIADHYGSGESAILAALAGIDLILFSHSFTDQHPLSVEVYYSLLEAVQSGRLPMQQIDEAVARVMALKEKYAIVGDPQLDLIRTPDHLELAQRAARAGLMLVKTQTDIFPLRDGIKAGVVEFASIIDSEIMEQGGLSGFITLLHQQTPHIPSISLRPMDYRPEDLARAREIATQSEVLILASRNAHLIPAQLEVARELLGLAKGSILMALRNPYDAQALGEADSILCTCGDSKPSLSAGVEALLGVISIEKRPAVWGEG
ncbi:MAG: beta-N-acetylhexosaminidase [Chloroflexi bacterium]|nr:beta-N-acetylhexosaminidase [Chloroflexota bacterium]